MAMEDRDTEEEVHHATRNQGGKEFSAGKWTWQKNDMFLPGDSMSAIGRTASIAHTAAHFIAEIRRQGHHAKLRQLVGTYPPPLHRRDLENGSLPSLFSGRPKSQRRAKNELHPQPLTQVDFERL